MPYLPLTQKPLAVSLKNANTVGREIFATFVEVLNSHLRQNGMDAIWYQPDNSRAWQYRYFWMFHYNSVERDFITRMNFVSKSALRVEFSHFGARKPKEVEFLPDHLFEILEYKGSPPHIRMESMDCCRELTPLIGEHYVRIFRHLGDGGVLPLRGTSHLEIALGRYLQKSDAAEWSRWHRPHCLGRREIDLASLEEKIAIEVQGDYWHRRDGSRDRDEKKRQDLLGDGWSLIWAWESGIKENFGLVLNAIDEARSGKQFVEIKRK